MLNINIHLDGNKEDAKKLDSCLVEFDEWIEASDDPSTDVELEEIYGHDDEIEELALKIANVLPNNDFIIEGCIDTSELAGECMKFKVEYKNRRLISKSSVWYIEMCPDEYQTFESFSEKYPIFSDEEEFEKFKYDMYYILESGKGECVKEVPLSYQKEIALDRQSICPVCGEKLPPSMLVPVCQDAEGVQYHIWCAEKLDKETIII